MHEVSISHPVDSHYLSIENIVNAFPSLIHGAKLQTCGLLSC